MPRASDPASPRPRPPLTTPQKLFLLGGVCLVIITLLAAGLEPTTALTVVGGTVFLAQQIARWLRAPTLPERGLEDDTETDVDPLDSSL